MKYSFLILSMLAAASAARASVTVNGAKIDVKSGYILVDVSYGGCKLPTFELKQEGCAESMPVQCYATVVQTSGDDGCERLNRSTAMFSIQEQGLKNSYYAGGSLKIRGAMDPMTGAQSSATIRLP